VSVHAGTLRLYIGIDAASGHNAAMSPSFEFRTDVPYEIKLVVDSPWVIFF